MTAANQFPPSAPPDDKAKYRQFLIDHQLDPNLNADALLRALEEKSDPERAQFQAHWDAFVAKETGTSEP